METLTRNAQNLYKVGLFSMSNPLHTAAKAEYDAKNPKIGTTISASIDASSTDVNWIKGVIPSEKASQFKAAQGDIRMLAGHRIAQAVEAQLTQDNSQTMRSGLRK